jgi:phosphopantetheinyl transferase
VADLPRRLEGLFRLCLWLGFWGVGVRNPSVRVWLLGSDQGSTGAAFELLPEDEQSECSRFLNPRDTSAFAVTRAALRCLLGNQIGVPPKDVLLVRNAWGKPMLADPQHRAELDFSVSHTGHFSAVAISSCGPVGVDIERADHQVSEIVRISAEVFGAATAAALHRLPPDYRNDTFLRLWTAGEACLKAMGSGFAGAGGRAPVTLSAGGSPQADEEWALYSLDLPSDYVGALAVPNSAKALLAFPILEATTISRLVSSTR